MTHGHEVKGGGRLEGVGVKGRVEIKGRKNWDNCILGHREINKTYLKRKT